MSEQESYPELINRLCTGASYLDVGCCFAQDIRRLAFDGAPTDNCVGVDLEPGFFGLSDQLFLDKGIFSAQLAAADIFEESDPLWAKFRGSFDIVHASSFFHLFGLSRQRLAASAIAKLIKPRPGSTVLGLQLAAVDEAENVPVVSEEEPTYCHSLASMQDLWLLAGREANFDAQGLTWSIQIKDRSVPQAMRIGLLANPKLKEITWVANVVSSERKT